MKKILPIFALSLALLLAGCSSGSTTCNFSGLTPNATYLIFFTSSNGVTTSVTRVSSASGTISVKTSSSSCSNVVAVQVINSNLTLTANPSSIYLPSPPSTVTITGQGFDTTYGMPKVEYFDGNGYLVGSVLATYVSYDGTSLQANVPDLSYVYSGTYQVKVINKTYQGYYAHIVGTATITATGRDRPDTDGDGWYDDQDCDPYDPYRNHDCSCGNTREGGHYEVQPEICPYY